MELLSSLLTILGAVFFGVPSLYYLYLWRMSSKSWNLTIDKMHLPPVSVLIPAYNEEKTIRFKLLNLSKVFYEKEKMQIILVDDASTDNTIGEARNFVQEHPELGLEIIHGQKRVGKSVALNNALKNAKHDIIVVTDADTFWSRDILVEALPFFSDLSVGALNGRQTLLNSEEALSTQTERVYLDLTYGLIKLGESKIYSTIIYHGLFSAYSRKYLTKFDLETDDSGTALDIVQNGGRTIFVPTAKCYEVPTYSWKAKISTKLRRADQLLAAYEKCLKLLFNRRLRLPLRIAVPEVFIYLVNPILFILLSVTILFFLATHLIYLLITITILSILLIIPSKIRLIFLEAVQDYTILFFAFLFLVSGEKFSMWETPGESRAMLNEEILRQNNLI
jgi:biofilm PGA synthesis N-glycosyltransferase PgaC